VSVLLIFVQLWMRARYASHSGRGSMGGTVVQQGRLQLIAGLPNEA